MGTTRVRHGPWYRRGMLALAAVSNTYAAAQSIVAALEAGQVWESAFPTISQFAGSELTEVADKAIALGADPDTIRTLLASVQSSEVIEVTGTAPVSPVGPAPKTKTPWLWILLGVAAAGGTAYYVHKKR
jgi:hypothetical protein